MSFFGELKRRNVFRVGIAYVVIAWVLLQMVDFALDLISAPNWIMQVFFLAAVVILPLVLVFSWVFEMTPEGIKRESEIDRSQSATQNTGRKLDRTIIIFLALAVVLLLADRFISKEYSPQPPAITVEIDDSGDDIAAHTPGANEVKSIAVLPFVNMSSDPEQEYFSDGISEEILNVLTRIPNLKVAARTSSFQFKGQNLDIAKIGRQLQVNHVLEGSVRKAGTTIRITAQLIEADTGFHLWSETFDRQLEDVFAIQDEIAAAIATELRARLTTELDAPSATVDLEAYELYLKGRGLAALRGEANLLEAIDILKAAIAIEPEYAPALATLAKAYAVLPWFSDKVQPGEMREQARQWASQALDSEPDNAEALSILAIVYSEIDLNWEGARRLLDKALQVNPGSVAANNFRGDLATRTGDLKNALKYESRAAELDPLGPVQLTDLANVYILMGEYQKVINLSERALALDPAFFSAYRHLADSYYALGDIDQLTRVSRMVEALPFVPADIPADISMKLIIARGELDMARTALLHRVQQVKAGEILASTVSFEAAQLGDFDTAGELLMQAYEEKDGTWIYPSYVRLPEQAPDSEPWQEFWRQPGVAELAELRRSHGFSPDAAGFGDGAKQ